jgi:TRAP-type transport system small permease protein
MLWLRRFDDALARLEDLVLILLMAALALILASNVGLRYLFGRPFTWTEEVVVAGFSWMIFIGAAACIRSHQHLRIDVLVRFLPRPLALLAGIATVLVMLLLIAGLVWHGLSYTRFVSGNLTPMLGISGAWLFAGMPVGMTLALVHTVRQLLDEGPVEVFKSEIERASDVQAQP